VLFYRCVHIGVSDVCARVLARVHACACVRVRVYACARWKSILRKTERGNGWYNGTGMTRSISRDGS